MSRMPIASSASPVIVPSRRLPRRHLWRPPSDYHAAKIGTRCWSGGKAHAESRRRLELGAAAEAELLNAVADGHSGTVFAAPLGDRECIVEPQRSERRGPDQTRADRRADDHIA